MDLNYVHRLKTNIYIYTLDCKNVDTEQAFIMNDETQQRAIQTFPEENVLS